MIVALHTHEMTISITVISHLSNRNTCS